ncbi:unnamed protein product [Closterium sp. NIES-65]|nr:unnamed protein product [Closterium sp. NIES-65]CAI5958773.1 unnamed protein product [Closterium sp. NIES-65]
MFCCFCRSRAADDDDDYATSLPPAPANRKHAAPTATGASAGVHEFASQMAAADDRVAMSSVAVLHAAQIRSIRSENAGDARPVGTPPSRGGSRGATPRESQRSPGVAGDWNRSYQGQSTPGAASGAGFGSNAAAVGSGVSGSGFCGAGGVHSMSEPRIATPGATGDKLPLSPLSGRAEASAEAEGALAGAALADTRAAAEAATTGTCGATGAYGANGADGIDGGIGGTDCTGGVDAAVGAGGTDGIGDAGAAVGRGREREREGLLVQALTNQMRQNGGEGEGGDGRARGRRNGEGGPLAQEPAGREAESAGEQEWRGVSMREGRGGGESELVSRSVTEASAGDLSAVASNIGVTFENSQK